MSIRPMYDYSRKGEELFIEKDNESARDFAPGIKAENFVPLPIRTVYPAARRGQQHAYFPEGVKESLDSFAIRAETGSHLMLGSVRVGGNLDFGGSNLEELGIHLTTLNARLETPDTVLTIA